MDIRRRSTYDEKELGVSKFTINFCNGIQVQNKQYIGTQDHQMPLGMNTGMNHQNYHIFLRYGMGYGVHSGLQFDIYVLNILHVQESLCTNSDKCQTGSRKFLHEGKD